MEYLNYVYAGCAVISLGLSCYHSIKRDMPKANNELIWAVIFYLFLTH